MAQNNFNFNGNVEEVIKDLLKDLPDYLDDSMSPPPKQETPQQYEPITPVKLTTGSQQTKQIAPLLPLDLSMSHIQPRVSISKYLEPIRIESSKVDLYTFGKSKGFAALEKTGDCPETKSETSLKRGISNALEKKDGIKKARQSTLSATKKQQWPPQISIADSSVLHKLLSENPGKIKQFERRVTEKEKEGTKCENPSRRLDDQVNRNKKENETQTEEEETGEILEIISNLEQMTDSLELEIKKIKLIMGIVKERFSGLKK